MKTKVYFKMALVAFIVLASSLLSTPSLMAYTDFGDTNLWDIVQVGSGFSATANTTQLNVTIPTNSLGNAGVLSKFTISGDFDMQVAYSLVNWPNNNGVELEFGFSKSNGDLIAGIGRNDLSVNSYGSEIIYGINDIFNSVATTDTSGALRITRVGDTITCYYLNGTWQTLGSETDVALGQDGIVDIMGYFNTSIRDVGTASATFSNFSIVPLPPTLLVLGGGVLGVGLPGLRKRILKG
jgi:hypothetical protein